MRDLGSLSNIIGSIASVRNYFADFVKNDPLFLPELEVAERILGLVKDGAVDQTTRDRVRGVLDEPMGEHYDGSGWCHLCSLIEEWLVVTRPVDDWTVSPLLRGRPQHVAGAAAASESAFQEGQEASGCQLLYLVQTSTKERDHPMCQVGAGSVRR